MKSPCVYLLLMSVLTVWTGACADCQPLWPSGVMPVPKGCPDPSLEWNLPEKRLSDAVLLVAPGGGYFGWAGDVEGVPTCEYFQRRGLVTVLLRYRTPRPPVPAEKHVWAWQDAQRAVRLVRQGASVLGLDGEKVGFMGFSAGGHLTLLAAVSSTSNAYPRVDATDDVPCHVNWAVPVYPAYVLSDGYDDCNAAKGNDLNLRLAPEFLFDEKTPPLCLMHGDDDAYSAMGSVRVYHRLRTMGIPAELHIMAEKPHVFFRNAHADEPAAHWLDRVWQWMTAMGINTVHPDVWKAPWHSLVRNNRPLQEDCAFSDGGWVRDVQNIISAVGESPMTVTSRPSERSGNYVLDFEYRSGASEDWHRVTLWRQDASVRCAVDGAMLPQADERAFLARVFSRDFPRKIAFLGVVGGCRPQLRHIRMKVAEKRK